eukprot:scaffold14066_cov62-Phaeocystis_antarctica.AAC.3
MACDEQLGAERHLRLRQLLDQLVRSRGVWRAPRPHCVHKQLPELPRSGHRRRLQETSEEAAAGQRGERQRYEHHVGGYAWVSTSRVPRAATRASMG